MEQQMKRAFAGMKNLEKEMHAIITSIQLPHIHWSDIEDHLSIHYPAAAEAIVQPPPWVDFLKDKMTELTEEGGSGEWKTVTKGKGKPLTIPKTLYGFWRRGLDIEFLQNTGSFVARLQELAQERKSLEDEGAPQDGGPDSDVIIEDPRLAFLSAVGIDEIPRPPLRKKPRGVGILLDDADVWSMTTAERNKLASSWEEDVRSQAYDANLHEFKAARERYDDACSNYKNIQDQVSTPCDAFIEFAHPHLPQARKELLSKTDLIGCTTTGQLRRSLGYALYSRSAGAAKLVSLLTVCH